MPIYGDFWMPAGYPIFLKVLRSISDQLWFTIAVQHGLGLSVGVLLYLAARRLGLTRFMSALISAVPLLSGDHLYLEHLIIADNFLIFLGAAGLTAAVYGLVPRANSKWLAIASAVLATAALVRSVGLVLPLVFVFCTILWIRGSTRERVRAVAIALIPGLAVIGLYAGIRVLSHGEYLGLVDMAGWNLYSRVAPFADCTRFEPPAGTRILCEERAPADRPGPFGYVWDLQSVPRKSLELGPTSGATLRKFARRAILHQPLDYCRAVLIDLIRYVSPSFYARNYAGQPPEVISFGFRDVAVEKLVADALSRGYRGTTVHWHGARILTLYQNVFCVRGTLILALAILTVFGALKGLGHLRLGVVLFGLSAFGLYLVPVLTLSVRFSLWNSARNISRSVWGVRYRFSMESLFLSKNHHVLMLCFYVFQNVKITAPVLRDVLN